MKTLVLFICVVVLLAAGVDAQSLEKRHQLGLKLGMWNQVTGVRTEISPLGVETSVGNNGLGGGIFYGHWLEENLALTFSIGGMALDISTKVGISGVTTETSAVASVLMGVKFYFVSSTLESSVRPYFKGSAGPFVGSQESVKVGFVPVNESRTETALGGQLGAGIDFVTGRHFMMGLGLGYNFMTDFDNPIGGSRNYSGPEFSFEFSWLFGKGID